MFNINTCFAGGLSVNLEYPDALVDNFKQCTYINPQNFIIGNFDKIVFKKKVDQNYHAYGRH